MLICRVQLPEDTALNQAAAAAVPAPNPSTRVVTGNTGDRNTSQNSPTTTPVARPPTVGAGAGTTGPSSSGFLTYLVNHVWSDPHLRICEFHGFGTVGFWTYRGDRVHLVVLPDCGQSTRNVVLSTPPSSGRHVFYVLAPSNHAFRR